LAGIRRSLAELIDRVAGSGTATGASDVSGSA